MKVKNALFFIALCMLNTCHAFFAHDRAVVHAQKNEFDKAKQELFSLVERAPEDASVLYDAGVAAYKTNAFDQAASYFKKSAELAKDSSLQEQAAFNEANAHVARKELQQAIDTYEALLQRNPEHERARHNLEIVKRMLQEQKQQEQEQEKQENNEQKNDSKDSKDDKKKKDKKKDRSKKEQRDEEKKRDERNEQDEQDEQNDKQHNDEQHHDEASQAGNEQEKNERSEQRDQSEPQRSNAEGKQDQRPGQAGSNDDREEQANMTPEQKQSDQNKASSDKGAQAQGKQASPQWLEQVLAAQEKKDAEAHKELLQAKLYQQSKARQEQSNGW
jgi:Ca-activated chloride channel family protein